MRTKNDVPAVDDKPEEKPEEKLEQLAAIEIVLDRPGVKACGEYKAGEVYKVEGVEAQRLMKAKGFRKATAEDKKQAAESAAESNK